MFGLPVGQYCDATGFDTRGWPMPFAAPEGTTRVDQLVICGAAQCQPGATIHAHVMEVTVDDPIPPSIALDGPLASGEWVSGPLGGATRWRNRRLTTRGSRASKSASDRVAKARSIPATGRRHSRARPVNSGLIPASATYPTVAYLDRCVSRCCRERVDAVSRSACRQHCTRSCRAPSRRRRDAWRTDQRTSLVSWTNSDQTIAQLASCAGTLEALCQRRELPCPRSPRRAESFKSCRSCMSRPRGSTDSTSGSRTLPETQREESGAIPAVLRFDPEPPQLAFEPMDPSDPLRVVVSAVDRHSGVASGEIEMRASGTTTWHGLATNREGSLLVAHVDDERFRNGAYEFRAHAVDQAGNEASTGRRSDGSAATLRLPARIDTRLAVGVPRTVVRRRSTRRRGTRKDYPAAWTGRWLRGTAGRFVSVDCLTNADGQPIEGATIEALEKPADGAASGRARDNRPQRQIPLRGEGEPEPRRCCSGMADLDESDPRRLISHCWFPRIRQSIRTADNS